MQIGSISSIAPSTPEPAASRTSKSALSVPNSTDNDASSPAKAPTSSSSSAAPAPKAQNNPMAAAYSTGVGGKTYSGSVSETGGVYEVAVTNVPGAHATGSSIQDAENNLNMRIDELV